jgi:hypothetical protein
VQTRAKTRPRGRSPLPWTDVRDGYTVTLLPPSNTTCNGGTHQQFPLRPVTALGNGQDYQLVAAHSGKCVDVSQVSTAAGAKIHQWTCDSASALGTEKNQIWRLLDKS